VSRGFLRLRIPFDAQYKLGDGEDNCDLEWSIRDMARRVTHERREFTWLKEKKLIGLCTNFLDYLERAEMFPIEIFRRV
jgi:hypothetical protein